LIPSQQVRAPGKHLLKKVSEPYFCWLISMGCPSFCIR
jgi:hypothetical protein